MFGGCSHHLWHALLAVSREDGCQLLEVFHFRIAYRLYVYPPFGRCALLHVLWVCRMRSFRTTSAKIAMNSGVFRRDCAKAKPFRQNNAAWSTTSCGKTWEMPELACTYSTTAFLNCWMHLCAERRLQKRCYRTCWQSS